MECLSVNQKLKEFIEDCDQQLINNCQKQVSQNLEAILKGQHSDQIRFGNDIDSDLLIVKNMDQKILNDPHATNKKSIENYFGDLD